LLGFFADTAGIQQYQVGIGRVTGGPISIFIQDGSNDFTVGKIHLTAITLYIKMLAVLVSIKGKWGISFALTVFIVVVEPGKWRYPGFM
jgi:hypothetical protein